MIFEKYNILKDLSFIKVIEFFRISPKLRVKTRRPYGIRRVL